MSIITLSCQMCGKEFHRTANEHRRNLKRNRLWYCSISCATTVPRVGYTRKSNSNSNRHIDKYTPVRMIYTRVKRTAPIRGIEFELSIDDLLDQWNSQKGICPYTGWKMLDCSVYGKGHLPNRATIDRIDSSKGYIKGNIQWVSAMANYAKNQFSHDEMVGFCKSIALLWS